MTMWINLFAAAGYLYFNWRYFALAAAVLRRPRFPKLLLAVTFVINYTLFYLCSMLEWTLMVNWGLFFLFQFAETALYCRDGWRLPLFLSLNGILHGLTVNIFCRCAVAIAMSQPLTAFDNHISAYGNLKSLPVFLGFVLGGVVLHLLALPKPLNRLRTLIAHPKHLAFQLELMTGMFLYLFLNLLLYQSHANNVFLKLWGIKSSIFSLVGSYLGLRYSLKMCELSDYREQNRTIRQELIHREREERQLRTMAYRDMLTGLYSRQYILDQIDRFIGQRTRFVLCFLDLDDLKSVNDHFGHTEGDRYLTTVARELECACRQDRDILARYGGDEFLLLFPEAELPAVEERMRQVGLRLAELTRGGDFPFPMSFSHGTVESSDSADAETLLASADEKMYQHKKMKMRVD